jgi:dihydrofolate synthase/folylpolyglutamate synthase
MFEFESSKDDSLKTIGQALELFWNPQNDYKIIHIAWTNGKGSVSKMLFSILKQFWKKVWVFTSPHLIDIRERFESDSWIISQGNFIRYVSQISTQNIKLAYFEKCFLISQLYFREQKCEYVIIETWVWGTFDTTNIVSPLLTCITSISYDHQWLLWDTLEEISTHKAGIIKPFIPLVINFHNAVIEARAMKLSAPIIFTNKKRYTNLLWEYQRSNAWLAWELAVHLGIDIGQVSSWLQNVDHKWRLQKI